MCFQWKRSTGGPGPGPGTGSGIGIFQSRFPTRSGAPQSSLNASTHVCSRHTRARLRRSETCSSCASNFGLFQSLGSPDTESNAPRPTRLRLWTLPLDYGPIRDLEKRGRQRAGARTQQDMSHDTDGGSLRFRRLHAVSVRPPCDGSGAQRVRDPRTGDRCRVSMSLAHATYALL